MDRRIPWGIAATSLLVMTLVVYIPALGGGYVWDDDRLVTDNPNITTAARLIRTWTDPLANTDFYPLTHASWWLEYRFWRLNPFVFHLDNVLLHAANAVLFWTILRFLAVPGGWAAAAIFALHPLHVESVAWISERKNVLSGLLCLLSVWMYLRFALDGGGMPPRRRRLFHGLSVLFFLLALLAKPVTMAAAAVLPLLLWWKRRSLRWRDLLPLIPYFALAAPMAALTTWVQYTHVNARGAMLDYSLAQRVIRAGRVPWFYAGKLAWPRNLTFAYPKWNLDPSAWRQYGFAVGAVAVLAALFLLRRRLGPGPLVAVSAFAIVLSPALGFVNIYWHRYYFVADHVPYLASMSLIALGTATAVRAAARLDGRRPLIIGGATAAVLAVLGALTWRQGGIYRDGETIWADTLRKDPGSFMAHSFLGTIAFQRGRMDQALRDFQEALRTGPDLPESHNNAGLALAALGRTEEAMSEYREALRIDPGFREARRNVRRLLRALGPTNDAIRRFPETIPTGAAEADADVDRANALEAQGRIEEAIADYRRALRLDPESAEAQTGLGRALAGQGRTEEAIEHFRAALGIDPRFAPASYNLGIAFAKQGRLEEAARLVEKTFQMTGRNDPDLLATLAAIYAEAGRFPEAAKTSRQAAALAREQGKMELATRVEAGLRFFNEGKR